MGKLAWFLHKNNYITSMQNPASSWEEETLEIRTDETRQEIYNVSFCRMCPNWFIIYNHLSQQRGNFRNDFSHLLSCFILLHEVFVFLPLEVCPVSAVQEHSLSEVCFILYLCRFLCTCETEGEFLNYEKQGKELRMVTQRHWKKLLCLLHQGPDFWHTMKPRDWACPLMLSTEAKLIHRSTSLESPFCGSWKERGVFRRSGLKCSLTLSLLGQGCPWL